MNITRQVISDLWPVYAAGEASADTRALVDEFLATDEAFRRTLQMPIALPPGSVSLAPGGELAALRRTSDLVRGGSWLRGLRLIAFAFTVFAITRAITDVPWATTPRRLIGDGLAAIVSWSAYALLLRYYRRRSLGK